ncbi:MAG: 3-hydroxyacyl-CoA dehydrogenase family protein [Acidimicrobiales bacterium]
MTDIQRVAVIGSGAMGAHIGMVCAIAGCRVTVVDLSAEALERARTALEEFTQRSVDKGKMTPAERTSAFERLRFTGELAPAVADADLVIEAVVEKLDVKRTLFVDLDVLCPPHTILASNSSSMMPSQLADATGRPDRVVNLHFFNPALIMRCVEVVRGPATSDETQAAAVAFVQRLGKEPVVLKKEIPGFIANRILNAVRDEAIALLEGGVAEVADIDRACRTALGYPMGPFELMDLTGLDIGYYVKKGRFELTGDPRDLPQPSLAERVESGRLGRKTGEGWYRYDEHGTKGPAATTNHTTAEEN